ncbi:MAG TPA: copper chaperone PCu(A)C [Aliidongia sp.]|uniref:copper chaperone PCu(A)C n=1 Tax=Aliidongia sp. TaxID=1914230 RepID=UPI002DDCB0A7|nr:copper chaperone PCu(A)C [Aliidongia sp.]HEV2678489.1 copper chaperone PCu(A)C [Aliidongia sp.]
MLKKLGWFVPVLLLLWASSAIAATDPISIDGAWARRSTRAHVVFVYMTISLAKGAEDVLIGASSPLADKVELLGLLPKRRGESLEPVLALELETHTPTVFQPGEAHLVLRGVKQKLKSGDSFPMTLRFANAGSRDVVVRLMDLSPDAGMPAMPKGVKLD